jgi:hypothetical protein
MSNEVKPDKQAEQAEEKPGTKSAKMGCLWSVIALIVVMLMFNSCGGDSGTTLNAEEQKQAILTFEQELYATEGTAKQAIDNHAKAAQGLADGSVSIYDVYEAASRAKGACEVTWKAIGEVEVPNAQPEIKELLIEAKDNIETAYFAKMTAMESAMAFYNAQQPKDLQEFKDNVAASTKFVMDGVLKLTEAKQKAGIDITKENTKE